MRRCVPGAVVLLVAASAACQRQASVVIDAQPGDLILVVRDERRIPGVTGAGLSATISRGAVPARQGVPIYWWVLPRTELIDSEGNPLSDEAVAAIKADVLTPDALRSGCGPCLVPALDLPQVLTPGDGCHPVLASQRGLDADGEMLTLNGAPEGPVSQATRDRFQDVRRRVCLRRPGVAICSAPKAPAPAGFLICPVAPADLPFAFERVAITSDGTVGVFAGQSSSIHPLDQPPVSVDGRPVVSMVTAAVGAPVPASAPPASAPPDFVVAGQVLTGEEKLEAIEVVGSLGRANTVPADPSDPFRARGAGPHSDPGLIRLVGERTQRPAVMRCGVDSGRNVTCESDSLEACPGASHVLHYVVQTSSGAVAMSDRGPFYVQAPDSNQWRCVDQDLKRWVVAKDNTTQTLSLSKITALAALEDRVFACWRAASVDDVPQGSVVLAASVSADLTAIEFETVYVSEQDCVGFARVDGRPDLLHVVFGDLVLELNRGGVAAPPAAPLIVPPEPARTVESPVPGWTLMTSHSFSVYRRPEGGSFERVFGPGGNPGVDYSTVAAFEDDTFIAHADAVTAVRVVDSARAGCGLGATPISILGQPIGQSTALVPEQGSGSYLLATDTPRLYRMRLDDACGGQGAACSAEAIELDRPDSALIAGAQLRSGLSVFIAREAVESAHDRCRLEVTDGLQSSLLVLRDGRLQPLPVDFDDPSTSSIEAAPARLEWLNIDASMGVGWVSGEDVVARIVPDSDGGVRAEGYWFSRLAAGFAPPRDREQPPAFTAIDVDCPNRVWLGAFEQFRESRDPDPDMLATGWQLGPVADSCSQNPADPSRSELSACETPAVRQAEAEGAGDCPVAIGAGAEAILVANQGLVFTAEADLQPRVPMLSISSAAFNGAGLMLAGGENAQLIGVRVLTP